MWRSWMRWLMSTNHICWLDRLLDPFSELINISKNRRDPREVQDKTEQGRRRLHIAIDCYERQHRAGRYFLHEHLDGASSWNDARMRALQRVSCVYIVSGPMCRCLMKLVGHDGEPGLVRKRIRWVTKSRALAEFLDSYCTNELGQEPHRHLTLMGGLRKFAAT